MQTLLTILLLVTQILNPDIRTLRMRYADSIEPERPYLVLGEDTQLEISFDEMSQDIRQYSYTIQHLDRNGIPDGLSSVEYLRGFSNLDITDYALSFNTSRIYTHYTLLFPNDDMQVTLSGNYALIVYESGYPERVQLVQRFEVVEPQTRIDARIRANTDIEINGRYQQLDITLSDLMGNNCANEYSIVVRQNGRTDNQVIAPRPTYVEGSRLRWSQCRDLIFEGGHEYRHIDLYSRMQGGTNVDRIRYDRDDYHAFLYPTLLRGTGAKYSGETISDKCGTPYIHEYDANGQFLINAERTDDSDTEAEYMWVHFILPASEPWIDGTVYIGGEWNQNRADNRNRMAYDYDTKCYYLTTLLKQGGYDFQYWFVESRPGTVDAHKKATLQRTEGSHWQTDNEYQIFVYYRPFGERYDQLVGISFLK